MFGVHGNLGKLPNTRSDGTSSFGPVVPLIAFTDILRVILPDSLLYSDFVALNMLLCGQ